jgi:hypothetical protein
MHVDEITIVSPDFPDGLSFGPVTLQRQWEGSVETRDELPVMLTPRCGQFLGIRWYLERYKARGVFTVTRDQILFRPTAALLVERAAWWRRAGYLFLTSWSPRRLRIREHAPSDR